MQDRPNLVQNQTLSKSVTMAFNEILLRLEINVFYRSMGLSSNIIRGSPIALPNLEIEVIKSTNGKRG